MKRTIIILSALLVLSTSSLFAQQKIKSVELTPFFNWENFDSGIFVNDASLYGLKIGFNFSKRMEGEFVYSLGSSDSDPYLIFYEETFMLDAREDDDISFWSFNFIYNFKPLKEKLVPFAEAGLGRYRIKRTTDVFFHNEESGETERVGRWIDSQSAPTMLLGGGLRYFFTKRYALRFEVTGTRYKHDVTGISYNSDLDEFYRKTTDDTFMNVQTSFGLSIFLGGKE